MSSSPSDPPQRILIAGATGYVGGRLLDRLVRHGYSVRVLVRDRERFAGRPHASDVDVVEGDVLQPDTLGPALAGVSAAYYLVHSMSDSADFHQRDLVAARNFATAARREAVGQIIYLGGLGKPDSTLSPHLRSRQETGAALREAGVPVTELRAAVIVGSGSVSFEMIRYLTERLPAMVCPRWVSTRIQPIAIDDVLTYLEAALSTPECAGQIIEIGGQDVMTYGAMMLGYARVRGLKRILIPVPLLTPHLSSLWVHLVTPISANLAHPLIEGLRNEVVVRDQKAQALFPTVRPMGYEAAVRKAVHEVESGQVISSWSDALASSRDRSQVTLADREGAMVEQRQQLVPATAHQVYTVFTGLGGRRGWLYANWAWEVRGLVDRLLGGVGLRRGRREPDGLQSGDALDFWRVEVIEPDRLLRLRAEMKVPGRAWLQFEARTESAQVTRLIQQAFFVPKGLAGLAYWYGLYPIHSLIFSGLIRAIARRAAAAAD